MKNSFGDTAFLTKADCLHAIEAGKQQVKTFCLFLELQNLYLLLLNVVDIR